jgi:hypothetical protein
MMMPGRSGRLVTRGARGLPGVVLAGALAALPACGAVVAGPGASQQTPSAAASGGQEAALCASTAHLGRMAVSLPGAAASRHAPAMLPRGVTIRDTAKVRAVAVALCGLPAMPSGPVPCPVDLGGSYRLTFSAPGRNFPPVMVRATGCRSVSGLGQARRATTAFWALLQKELGAGVRARPTTVPAVP